MSNHRGFSRRQFLWGLGAAPFVPSFMPSYYELIAAERKPRMMLLPYGIPICVGTIGYFLFNGML